MSYFAAINMTGRLIGSGYPGYSSAVFRDHYYIEGITEGGLITGEHGEVAIVNGNGSTPNEQHTSYGVIVMPQLQAPVTPSGVGDVTSAFFYSDANHLIGTADHMLIISNKTQIIHNGASTYGGRAIASAAWVTGGAGCSANPCTTRAQWNGAVLDSTSWSSLFIDPTGLFFCLSAGSGSWGPGYDTPTFGTLAGGNPLVDLYDGSLITSYDDPSVNPGAGTNALGPYTAVCNGRSG